MPLEVQVWFGTDETIGYGIHNIPSDNWISGVNNNLQYTQIRFYSLSRAMYLIELSNEQKLLISIIRQWDFTSTPKSHKFGRGLP